MWHRADRQQGCGGSRDVARTKPLIAASPSTPLRVEIGDLGGVEPRATDQWLPVPSAKGVQVGGGSFHHTVRVS